MIFNFLDELIGNSEFIIIHTVRRQSLDTRICKTCFLLLLFS